MQKGNFSPEQERELKRLQNSIRDSIFLYQLKTHTRQYEIAQSSGVSFASIYNVMSKSPSKIETLVKILTSIGLRLVIEPIDDNV